MILTDNEKKALEKTDDLWGDFVRLNHYHKLNDDDLKDFRYHLHALQHIILSRPARRELKEIEVQKNTHYE